MFVGYIYQLTLKESRETSNYNTKTYGRVLALAMDTGIVAVSNG